MEADKLQLKPETGPWLVYVDGKHGEIQTFFSLTENHSETKNIVELRHKRIITCMHGWFVLVDDDSNGCSLLNPVSMKKIQLPSCSWDPNLHSGCVLSSPPENPQCTVLFFVIDTNWTFTFMFCKPGDAEWNRHELERPEIEGFIDNFSAIGVYKGDIFMLTFCEKLFIIKVSQSNRIVFLDLEVDHTSIHGPFKGYVAPSYYLVESSYGELLRVDLGYYYHDLAEIEVFKFDFEKKVWTKIKRMNDLAIFIGLHKQILAFSTKDSLIKGNTIHLVLPNDPSLYTYNLQDDTLGVSLPCPNVERPRPTWILPSS